MNPRTIRPVALAALAALGLALVTSGTVAAAVAQGDLSPADEKAIACLDAVRGTLTATPRKLDLGGTVKLTWKVNPPRGCSALRYTLGGTAVGKSGTMTVHPIASRRWVLGAAYGSAAGRQVAAVDVEVVLPADLTISDTSHPDTRLQLAQALLTPGSRVTLANHVDLDVTHMPSMYVVDDVVLRGGRGGRETGPRLFSTTRAPAVLRVIGDRVRITGIRLEGPEMGVSESDEGSRGIVVESAVDVEIDHNEISGWSTIGIEVLDRGERLDWRVNPEAVRIHDNYIHHNQHLGSGGYGVKVGLGAFAQISRNVFDWNRHAIEGDGHSNSGYEATDNLVLPNGGLHRWIPFPGFWVHTHQFDMHGSQNCGIADWFSDALWNCGVAGDRMVIRHNTFLYTAGAAIKLRGTPVDGMYVGHNVFKAPFLLDMAMGTTAVAGTVQQTETGLVIEDGNRTGIDGSAQLGRCDFDADGLADTFMATGATWWYASGGTGPWTFVNRSTKLLHELQLGQYDGDGRCDVMVAGIVYSAGVKATVTYWAGPTKATKGGAGGGLVAAR